MSKQVRALVVAVNRPGMGSDFRALTKVQQPLAASANTWEVTVTWMSKPYEFQCPHTGEIVQVRPKKRKAKVFTNYRPELHTWIQAAFL